MKLQIKFFPFHWQDFQFFHLMKTDPICGVENILHANVFSVFCYAPYIDGSKFFLDIDTLLELGIFLLYKISSANI